MQNLGLLLFVAIGVVYIVLGILYESYIHPITILSGLPSAGLGALITLWLFGNELNVYSFVGLVMLVGIVKKNAVMQIDFALEAERQHQKEQRAAHRQIEEQHGDARGEHGQREQQQDRRDEERPDHERHAEQAHARRAHVDDGGDVVDRAHHRSDTHDEEADAPDVLTPVDAGVLHHRRQRRVRRPARARVAADTTREMRPEDRVVRERLREVSERRVEHAALPPIPPP